MIALRTNKNMKFTLSDFFKLKSFVITKSELKKILWWDNYFSFVFDRFIRDRVKNELLYEYYFDYILAAKTTQTERL